MHKTRCSQYIVTVACSTVDYIYTHTTRLSCYSQYFVFITGSLHFAAITEVDFVGTRECRVANRKLKIEAAGSPLTIVRSSNPPGKTHRIPQTKQTAYIKFFHCAWCVLEKSQIFVLDYGIGQ